ncbi:patr class I histocompatibility antigen, B-1 alpha chain-like [Colossoma macropomum]|uniref:patr class I histocompatibility antigen, B-1 alpha chain-like n=1 Tax=Colossoma macropomum TaxID=42526 RepID=UPI00186405C3|nr:patr class I histocompatibility antigen, B-1 alpha chain-like [Colossoma macropomum]
MDHCAVIMKSVFIITVHIHQTSAVSHSPQYFYTAVTPEIHFPEFTAVGLVDGERIDYYDSNIKKLIPKTDWMQDIGSEDYWNTQTRGLQANQEVFKVNMAVLMQRFNQTEGVNTWQWMYGCELHDGGTKRSYMQYGYDGEDYISLDVNTLTWTAANAKAVITKHKWERRGEANFRKAYLENTCAEWLQRFVEYGRSTLERKESQAVTVYTAIGGYISVPFKEKKSLDEVLKFYGSANLKMDHCTLVLKYLLLLSVNIHLTSAASHSLQYVYTAAVTQGTRFPEFTVVGLLDGEQIVYYDSDTRKMIPRTEWMRMTDTDDSVAMLKISVDTLIQRFNKTKGVQTLQRMFGCELHDDGTKRLYDQLGCDGEDVIILDLNTISWTAANQKAVSAKQNWERTCDASYRKAHLENECIYWLQKFVEYGRSTLERKVSPEVSLFQKDSSSPVVCHATGFFPKAVNISWQKNGEDLLEDVELRETLPNQDGTFQKRSVLTVSPEELNKHHYTCIIRHSSLEKELELQVSECRVLSGRRNLILQGIKATIMLKFTMYLSGVSGGGSVGVIVAGVVAVLLLVLIGCMVVFIRKRKQSGFKRVSGNSRASSEGDSSSSTS